MRDSKAISHAGGAELLTVLEGSEDSVLVVGIAKLDCLARQELKHVVDALSFDIQENIGGCDHFTHFRFLSQNLMSCLPVSLRNYLWL